jgi:hypothetical protein
MVDLTITFLVIDSLYDRYTIVVNDSTKRTSVYCDECDEWVATYEGEMLSKHTVTDFFEKIVDAHERQVLGERVHFDDSLESILT